MSRPHRIAFGITELDLGGAERMLTELVTRLDRTEWEPHVYCLGPEAHFANVLRDRQVPVTCFGARGWMSTPRVLRQWTKALRQLQPEILYCWLFHASLLGRIAGRWANVPHVLSGVRVAERRNSWHGRLDRWTNSLVELNICVSRGVADFVEDEIGLDSRKTVIVSNAIDAEPYRTASPTDLTQFGIPHGSLVLLTVGRLEHQKGIDLLIDAAVQVIPRFSQAHFLIVGSGPDRPLLESLAHRTGVERHVHWAGARSDVAGLLKSSVALVLPSRWEGMPNVVLEAMAAGKPVVATDVEGVRELVRPGLNGWVVPKENPQSLAHSLCELLGNPGVSDVMGKSSQDIISNEFTIESFIGNHTRIWRQLVPTSCSTIGHQV